MDALAKTGATLGFDATGGGELASQILTCMERALLRSGSALGPYGSTTLKQVYLYGSLDMSPTRLDRNFGMAWGVGGWLLPPFLARIGPARTAELQARVAGEIKTTFASEYTRVISLRDALQLETLEAYTRKATGEKFLIDPSRD